MGVAYRYFACGSYLRDFTLRDDVLPRVLQ